jgi:hypothetical protein
MNLENLKPKIDELLTTFDIIKQNRECWQTKTKSLLTEILTKITTEYPIGWQVQILDWTKNSEGVNITFNPKPSGISEMTDKSAKSYIKEGGTIAFSQAYNGEVFVIIFYPFVDKFVTQTENKLIGKFKPETITEDFINSKVSIFIDEMIKWEKSTYGNSIGFKID